MVGAGEVSRCIEESLLRTIRFRSVRLLTLCKAELCSASFTEPLRECLRLRLSNLAVVSSSWSSSYSCFSSSSLKCKSAEGPLLESLKALLLLRDKPLWPSYMSTRDETDETERELRWLSAAEVRPRRLPSSRAVPESSPTLPVEFVAGGEGRPVSDAFDEPPGLLGGSGRRGRSGGVEVDVKGEEPM